MSMSERPLLLDLFCGAGGAAKGYYDSGFDVVGVDLFPQPNYPYKFIQADALEFMEAAHLNMWAGFYLLDFDAIHASPPCQAYTGLNNDKSEHLRLITPTRVLLSRTGLPYVIENVVGARGDMLDPITLTGEWFGLNIKRARLFETNWKLRPPPSAGIIGGDRQKFLVFEHGKWRWTPNVPVYGNGGRKAVEYWPHAMGVGSTWDDCWMTREELAEAIPPAYTEFIGKQLLARMRQEAAA